MTVSIKDGFKFLGITIVTFCAVFVCTFFLNFYIDAKSVASLITDSQTLILYNAQMATAKFTCAISGGFLSLTAAVMLVFYIRLYVDANARKIGILKAMGYSDLRMASPILRTPLSRGTRWAITFNKLVFPAPFSPVIPIRSPA